MAKFAKFLYSVSLNKSSVLFELIHMDIWSSYRVPTHKCNKYFLTIVDDNNRSTWLYLLKQKSQALDALHNLEYDFY